MSQTTLAASVASTDTSIDIDSWTALAGSREPPQRVAVNAEMMLVRERSGDTLTVERTTASLEVQAVDHFTRGQAEATSWRYSDDGLNFWQGADTDADVEAQVIGGRGEVLIATAATNITPAFIMQNPLGDYQVRFRFYLPDDVDTIVDAYLRNDENPTADAYRARLTINSAGAPSLRLSKNVASVNTALAAAVTPAGTVTLNAEWNLALQATGSGTTALAAKAWATADGEPAAWDTTASDGEAGLQTPNHAGLRLRATNAGVRLQVDDFIVSRVPEGVTHDAGAVVVLVEDWPYASSVVTGMGPPASNPPTGAEYIDVSTVPPTFYRRVGANWWSYP